MSTGIVWRKRASWMQLSIVLVTCLVGGTAMAQPDEFNQRGGYVGLGANYLVSSFQGVAGKLDFGNTGGFNIRGGYRFNEYLAAEGI